MGQIDLKTEAVIRQAYLPNVIAIALSPDERILATGHRDGQIMLLSASDFTLVGTIANQSNTTSVLTFRSSQTNSVNDLIFIDAPTGYMLAAAGGDGIVRIWSFDVE